MRNKMTSRFCMIALAISSVMGTAGVSQAFDFDREPITRMGRFFGFGWSDGYHACRNSGIQPAANLPPLAYYQKYGCAQCRSGHCGLHGVGMPGLGRWRSGDCDGSNCDTGNCDGGSCDAQSPSCDGGACDTVNSAPFLMNYSPRVAIPMESHCTAPGCDSGSCDGCDSRPFLPHLMPRSRGMAPYPGSQRGTAPKSPATAPTSKSSVEEIGPYDVRNRTDSQPTASKGPMKVISSMVPKMPNFSFPGFGKEKSGVPAWDPNRGPTVKPASTRKPSPSLFIRQP